MLTSDVVCKRYANDYTKGERIMSTPKVRKRKSAEEKLYESSTTPAITPPPLDTFAVSLLDGPGLGDWEDKHIEILLNDLVEWVLREEKPLLARWVRERRIAPSLVERWVVEGRAEVCGPRDDRSPKKKFSEAWEWARQSSSCILAEGSLTRKYDMATAMRLLPVQDAQTAAWEREKMARGGGSLGGTTVELRLAPARAALPPMDGDDT